MRSSRIFSALAALGLVAAMAPVAMITAAPVLAVQTVQATFISVSCPSYSVVPANKTPTVFDETGGHAAQLDTSYQTAIVNPATDIPASCTRTDGWQFQLWSDPALSVPDRAPITTGADGAGTGSVTIVLTPAEIALAQTVGIPTGLWITAILQPSIASFGALRCFTDINNGDDRENIHGLLSTDTQTNCIAYEVLPPSTFHAIAPERLLDTRIGNGLSGKLLANTPATFQVTGRGPAPVPSSATAVTGNLTVTGSTSSWAVYLGPVPTASPTSSTISFTAGEIRANGVTVALGAGGTLSATYISTAGNTTDLVLDVTGYYQSDAAGATFHPIAPVRLLDSRVGNGLSGKLLANTPAAFQVAGRPGVPSNATAVTGNVTVVNSTNSWAVFVGPDAEASPTTSTLNFNAGQIVPNNLTVALSSSGTLWATYVSTPGNTTDLVFDLTGYFTPDLTGEQYIAMTPVRMLDSRVANGLPGQLLANTPAPFQITGRAGIPATATGITGNLTVVNESASWAVFLGPNQIASPTSSTLNFIPGDVVANGVAVALGPGGTLSTTYISTAGNTTDLVLDVTGFFAP